MKRLETAALKRQSWPWAQFESFFPFLLAAMESLNYVTLCNIASFLDLVNFRTFVRICRASAACRNDLRTLAFVAFNSEECGPERVVFASFGPSAMHFVADKCVKEMARTCYSAILVAVDDNDARALKLFAPLCDRETVLEVIGELDDEPSMMMEALRYLDVPPGLYDFLRQKSPALGMTEGVFDAVIRFNRTGELPTQLDDFVKLADVILGWDRFGVMRRLISALEETDATGSLKADNVDRVVAWLETLPRGGRSENDPFFTFREEKGVCLTVKLMRPYAESYSRFFAIAPRPLTLEQQLGMFRVCFNGFYFHQAVALYAHSEQEAEMLLEYHTCCDETACANEKLRRRIKLWAFAQWPLSSLGEEGYADLANCVVFDLGGHLDSIFQMIARLASQDLE